MTRVFSPSPFPSPLSNLTSRNILYEEDWGQVRDGALNVILQTLNAY